MYKNILNDYLPWDGSHLGNYDDVIVKQWLTNGLTYYIITLPQGWCNTLTDKQTQLKAGVLCCTGVYSKNVFPCIVEELKPLFGLTKRGIHRIIINEKSYVLYYIPITVNGELIWETPLNQLDLRHSIRLNPLFRFEIQKIIAFCDLLSLTSTNESHILIRPGVGTSYVPISSNESNTTIVRGSDNDFSIISKVLFTRWFGEDTPIDIVVKSMVGYSVQDNVTVTIAKLRDEIDNIIMKYDRKLSWYVHFILSRASKHLLM